MSYEPKEGSGALFKNDKGTNAARPDYRGDVMVGGVLYELSAWIKPLPSDTSKRFMSLSAKPKQAKQPEQPRQAPARQQAPAKPAAGFEDFESDVPF